MGSDKSDDDSDNDSSELEECFLPREVQEKVGLIDRCFIDEKWFYTTSRRRRLKILPAGDGEDPDKVAPHIPTTLSRRNSIKSMSIGIVANPVPEHDFDGKIFLRRISKKDKYKKKSHPQNFTANASLNGLLKDGERKQLVVNEDGMRLTHLRESIADNYFLDGETTDNLVLRYYLDSSSDKPKPKYVD